MVFDVESIGLHGDGFSVGWVVVGRDGKEVSCGAAGMDPSHACGGDAGREWIEKNLPEPSWSYGHPRLTTVRSHFWSAWVQWKSQGAVLAADCPWPVEARFLIACVDDWPQERNDWQSPYPLIDVASVRLAAGLDPLATCDRLPDELPAHDPLADARQSARLLIEALNVAAKEPIQCSP